MNDVYWAENRFQFSKDKTCKSDTRYIESSCTEIHFSECELMFMFAICRRPSVRLSSVCLSVCLSSVTFVHPTQAIEIFGNVSTPFGTLAICDPSVKILRKSSKGNPSVGGLNQRVVEIVAILDLSEAISRKRCKIGGKLLLITNRKLHGLSIGTKLDYLEWPWTA